MNDDELFVKDQLAEDIHAKDFNLQVVGGCFKRSSNPTISELCKLANMLNCKLVVRIVPGDVFLVPVKKEKLAQVRDFVYYNQKIQWEEKQ